MRTRLLCIAPLLLGACLDQPFSTNVDLPLQVIAVVPSEGAVGVARDTTIQVLFNLPVVEASVTSPDAFRVEDVTDADAPVEVEGEIAYDAGAGDVPPSATFTPAALLPYSAKIRVTLTTKIKRAASQEIPEGTLLKDVVVAFFTLDPPPLQVVAVDPAPGATGVARDTTIAVTFSEPVRCATLVAGATVVENRDAHPRIDQAGQAVPVDGTWACTDPVSIEDFTCDAGACTVIFTPAAPFEYSSRVDVSLAGGTREASALESFRATGLGGQLPADVAWSFGTVDPAPLALAGSSPAASAEQVDPATPIVLIFTEPVSCASLATGLLVEETLDPARGGTTAAVAGAIACTAPASIDDLACDGGACSVTFTPSALFGLSSTVTVTLSGGVFPAAVESNRATTVSGQLPADVVFSFHVLDPPPLRVVSTFPGNTASGIPLDANLVVAFSEAVDCATVDAAITAGTILVTETFDAEVAVRRGAATVVHGVTVVSCADARLELDVTDDLELSSTVEVGLPGTIASVRATSVGGFLEDGAGVIWFFDTSDPPSLLVVYTSPGDGNTLVPATQPIVVRFNEPVDPTSVSAATFIVEQLDSGGLVVGTLSTLCGDAAAGTTGPCSYALSQDGTTVTFTPPADLAYDTRYRFTLTTAIQSARATGAGGSLAADLVYSFKTIVTPPIEVVSLLPEDTVISVRPTFTLTFNQDVFAPIVDDPDPTVLDVYLAPIQNPGDAPDPALHVGLACTNCNTTGTTYTFTTTEDLLPGTLYTFVVRGDLDGVRGVRGGSIMLADFLRTYAATTNPLLIVTNPADGAIDVSPATPVCAVFKSDIDPATVTTTTFAVTATNDLGTETALPGTFTFDGFDPGTGQASTTLTTNRVCFLPDPSVLPCREVDELLPANAVVTVMLASSIGNATETLGADIIYSFTTGGLPTNLDTGFDTIAIIGATGALDGATDVPVNASFFGSFSDPIDAAALAAVSLIDLRSGTPVAATVTVEDGGLAVRLQPTANLAYVDDNAPGYALRIAGGASGLTFVDGRWLGSDVDAPFTTSPKTQVELSPPLGEPGVASMSVPVTFSRPMYLPSLTSETIVGTSFTTSSELTAVVATNADDDDSAVYTAIPTFVPGDDVEIRVNTGAMDYLGNPLPQDTFVAYTAALGTSIQSAPALNARKPSDVAAANLAPLTGAVSGDQVFTLTMPAPGAQLQNRMIPATFNTSTLRVIDVGGCNGAAGATLATVNDFDIGAAGLPDVITFRAVAQLVAGCTYQVRLVQSQFANIFTASNTAADIVVTYTVETTAPALTSIVPANAAAGVAPNAQVVATFSETLDPATVTATSFGVSDGAADVAGALSVTGGVVTFAPAAPLRGGTTYTVTMTSAIEDAAGNAFAGATPTFTVESVAPTVVSAVVNGAGDVVVTFSEPMAGASLSEETTTLPGTLQVRDGPNVVYGCVDVEGAVATFHPLAPLAVGTTYDVTIAIGATDLGGTALASPATVQVTP